MFSYMTIINNFLKNAAHERTSTYDSVMRCLIFKINKILRFDSFYIFTIKKMVCIRAFTTAKFTVAGRDLCF